MVDNLSIELHITKFGLLYSVAFYFFDSAHSQVKLVFQGVGIIFSLLSLVRPNRILVRIERFSVDNINIQWLLLHYGL